MTLFSECENVSEPDKAQSGRRPSLGNKKGDSPGHPWNCPLKIGTKKGKATPTALEAPLPINFYPLDFV